MPYERTFIHNHVVYRAAVWPMTDTDPVGRIDVSGGAGVIGAARFTRAGFIEVASRLAQMQAHLDALLADEMNRLP